MTGDDMAAIAGTLNFLFPELEVDEDEGDDACAVLVERTTGRGTKKHRLETAEEVRAFLRVALQK